MDHAFDVQLNSATGHHPTSPQTVICADPNVADLTGRPRKGLTQRRWLSQLSSCQPSRTRPVGGNRNRSRLLAESTRGHLVRLSTGLRPDLPVGESPRRIGGRLSGNAAFVDGPNIARSALPASAHSRVILPRPSESRALVPLGDLACCVYGRDCPPAASSAKGVLCSSLEKLNQSPPYGFQSVGQPQRSIRRIRNRARRARGPPVTPWRTSIRRLAETGEAQ